VWKWWEEERLPDGVKWRTLEHSVCEGREGGEGLVGRGVLALAIMCVQASAGLLSVLSLQGPAFPPPYQPLPKDVKFYYNGQPMQLEPAAEEVRGGQVCVCVCVCMCEVRRSAV